MSSFFVHISFTDFDDVIIVIYLYEWNFFMDYMFKWHININSSVAIPSAVISVTLDIWYLTTVASLGIHTIYIVLFGGQTI